MKYFRTTSSYSSYQAASRTSGNPLANINIPIPGLKSLGVIMIMALLQGCSAYELWFGGEQPLMSTIIIKNDVPHHIGEYSEADRQAQPGVIGNKALSELGFEQDEFEKLEQSDPETAKKLKAAAAKFVMGRETQGYLITWSPEYNGAFVASSGHGCIQPAMYARTEDGSLSLPTELFTKMQGTETASADYNEAIEKLIAVNDQTTFLSIGTYGICQLAAIDKLDKQQASELMKDLFVKAASLRSGPQTAQEPPVSDDEGAETVAVRVSDVTQNEQ